VSLQRTARKFLWFEHPTTKKILWFPGLKLKQPTISHKKNFLQARKEVLARALFLGCTVTLLQYSSWMEALVMEELDSSSHVVRIFWHDYHQQMIEKVVY